MVLEKYSIGIGDRFWHQGKAQLRALIMAKEKGIDIVPVWNKSYREHSTVKTQPGSVRLEADEVVKSIGWGNSYYVDADHIGMKNVDFFIKSSDFFTIDVADFINLPANENHIKNYMNRFGKYEGEIKFSESGKPFYITQSLIKDIGSRFLNAINEAGRIYRHIESIKGRDNFVTEISMDETKTPQTPIELFFILGAISAEEIPVQTIAPKFTGRFNKGVDYVGEISKFAEEFEDDVAVIDLAIKEFNLPKNLKLSIHSGSDKFSIYKPINRIIKRYNAGLHLKTAGTTWLEEVIGLALACEEGLDIAKHIYKMAFERFDELCQPYLAVIDISMDQLPSVKTVDEWSGKEFADALRHDISCNSYNPNFRQLLHIAYKIAAEMGDTYYKALVKFEDIIAENVTENIYKRHIMAIFS